MKPTPGPWKIGQQCPPFETIDSANGTWVASVEDVYPEQQANAHLIAAAPEMLAALQEAQDHLEFCSYGDSYERECARENKLPQLINAAITKALEGQDDDDT